MKIVEDFDGDTFRAAYTVSFPKAVYLLHVFKKTPKPDRERTRVRLREAEAHYERNYQRRAP